MNVEVATVTTIIVFKTLFSADVAFAKSVIFFIVVCIDDLGVRDGNSAHDL